MGKARENPVHRSETQAHNVSVSPKKDRRCKESMVGSKAESWEEEGCLEPSA
jgi:hypothetical protein